MKLLYFALLFLSIQHLFAQTTQAWDGAYEGNILGITARLNGQKSNTGWTATIDANNYVINLQGSIVEMHSTGTMSDPQAGTSIPYEAILKGNQILLNIEDINPNSGQMEKMQFTFTKSIDQEEKINSPTSSIPATKSNHDQNLLGTWRHTESYLSGDFSFATDWFLWINADGSFQYSDGRTAGGGTDASIDSGSGDIHEAKWKTENKSIFVDWGEGWQLYAHYYQENNNLMLTYSNGKKQVWEKL